MFKFTQALLVFCISITSSASLKADGLLGKQLSGIENSILNERIIHRQNELINQSITKLQKKTKKTLNNKSLFTALPDGEVSSLILPVSNLAESLNIVDNAGNTLFRDVVVENGWRAIEQQWLVMSSPQELKLLQQLAQDKVIELVKTKEFNALALTLVQFKVSASLDNAKQLASVLPVSLQKKLTRDYVYQAQASTAQTSKTSLSSTKPKQVFRELSTSTLNYAACLAPLSIGMVDTAIEDQHPVFKNKSLIRQSFVDNKLTSPKAHGTAISALFISNSVELPALLPNAKLYAAEVFYGQSDFSQGANLFSLVAGINWLLSQQVSVINLSLAGPDNAILARVIKTALAQDIIIVAAVGNEGPHSPPLYPAAYEQVIGVTAIDKNNKLYRWANRGDYVDFSALGVSVKTARLSGDFGYESGTSMAAPVVSAYAACAKQQAVQTSDNKTDYWHILSEQAIDLGERGLDPLFGYGRIGL
ncbi:S8 family serine peptidase [Thalassotalea agariperforans]